MTGLAYRRDIDGIRAIAVLAIIVFHANAKALPGGYLGVDIFFVLSGFLITSILLREHDSGTFSIARFYERRIRRILPALFAMLAATAVIAYVVMLPYELRVFSQNLVAVVLFSSNILFWQRAGFFDFYFDGPAHLNPLLHTWSLGVEEQFYVVFPLLLALAWRWGRRRAFQTVLAVAVASFVLSSLIDGDWGLGWRTRREADFYLLPSRAWELMVGALLAFRSNRWALTSARAEGAAGLGLGAVLLAISTFHADAIHFPSLFALVPTLGTALLILYADGTSVGRLLSSAPMVGIGLVSYSAYLWHQPIFALAHSTSLYDELPVPLSLALGATTLVIAWASWRWIESPFRDRARTSRQTVFLWSGALAVLLLGVGLGIARRPTPPTFGRLIPGQLIETSQDRVKVMQDCGFRAGVTDVGCALNPARDTGTPDFLVIGDSHAAALVTAFESIARRAQLNGRLVALAGCEPLLGQLYKAQASNCAPMQDAALAYVTAKHVPRVVLASRWAWYTDQDVARSRQAFPIGFARTMDAYRALGVQVTIVEQVPQQLYRPVGLYTQSFLHRNRLGFLLDHATTPATHREHQRIVNETFDRYRGDATVRFVAPADVLCDTTRCAVGTADVSFYWDQSHLSVAGANRLGEFLGTALAIPSRRPSASRAAPRRASAPRWPTRGSHAP